MYVCMYTRPFIRILGWELLKNRQNKKPKGIKISFRASYRH